MKHFFDLVFYKAIAELRAENSRAMAGYLWWVLDPLMTLGVYYAVFGFLRPNKGNFIVYLFTGIILWRWFSATVKRSANSLYVNRNLMLQVNLNKMILPLSIVVIDMIKFCITLLLLFILLFSIGEFPNMSWLGIPVLLATELFLIIACSFVVAAITPLFPDFQNILNTLLMLMMYSSAIFYSLDALPENIQAVLQYNPMASIIKQFRLIVVDANFIDMKMLVVVWAESLAIFGRVRDIETARQNIPEN